MSKCPLRCPLTTAAIGLATRALIYACLHLAFRPRGASNACGLGALQAAVHARSAKDRVGTCRQCIKCCACQPPAQERSQEAKLNEEDRSIFAASLLEKADTASEKSNSSLSMTSDSMTTDLKTNGNEALQALEKLGSIEHNVTVRIVMSLVPLPCCWTRFAPPSTDPRPRHLMFKDFWLICSNIA